MSINRHADNGLPPVARERRHAWKIALALTLALVFLAPISRIVKAAPAEDSSTYLLQLQGRSFVPPEHDFTAALAYLGSHAQDGTAHLIVQMVDVPNADQRFSLAGRGLVLQGYLPERAYYALVSTQLTASDLSALGVRWAAPLSVVEKVSQRVQSGDYAPWTDYTNGRKIFIIQFHDDIAREAAEKLLAPIGGVSGGWISGLNAEMLAMDPKQAETLASEDAVKWIDERPPVLTAVNDQVRAALGVNTIQAAPYNLNGGGSSVLVYDVGFADKTHPDFGSPTRVTWGENGSIATHSTHVSGTIAGDGHNSSGTYKGMAPAAFITSYEYESCTPYCLYNSPGDIEANYKDGLFNHGDNLASNSLGSNIAANGYPCSWEGDYELTAQLLDNIANGVLGIPFLSCWAAGNERGYGTCGTGYSTTGVPATAKDPIVVGATNSNDHSMTYFSSWGPVDDGRIRPDVCAPGCQVGGDNGTTSTVPGGGYESMCGTSMATPATAGVIADLLQQWRMTPGLPLKPAPSTIKALMINTAFDYGNVGPDYQFGYGEIRAVDVIDHLRNKDLLKIASIDQGGEDTYPITVNSGTPVLKATLCWDDPPGQTLAQKELVNDLDLTLESPNGAITLPWILNPSNPGAAATKGADHLNPTEQVEVDNPVAGTWTVHVKAYQIPQGPQRYSVVANAVLGTSSAPESARSASSLAVASYPNPFSPVTTISFRLADSGPVSLYIFDSGGRRVRALLSGEAMPAGTHVVTWDGRNDRGEKLSTGVYFYQVVTGAGSAERKMLMVR